MANFINISDCTFRYPESLLTELLYSVFPIDFLNLGLIHYNLLGHLGSHNLTLPLSSPMETTEF